jgi:ABC-2 type transport system permease protein
LTYFPYAQLLDAPIRLYTGEYTPGDALRVYVLQAFWVVVLVAIGAAMWNANRKRMIVQGG